MAGRLARSRKSRHTDTRTHTHVCAPCSHSLPAQLEAEQRLRRQQELLRQQRSRNEAFFGASGAGAAQGEDAEGQQVGVDAAYLVTMQTGPQFQPVPCVVQGSVLWTPPPSLPAAPAHAASTRACLYLLFHHMPLPHLPAPLCFNMTPSCHRARLNSA